MALNEKIKVIGCVVLLGLFLAGCQTDGAALPSVYCKVDSPITWSKKDTRPTVRQIVGHNAAFLKLCN
jgi:PBP1b-binding outer membrane lipoprotein LpoB